jgi:hypothetical protein
MFEFYLVTQLIRGKKRKGGLIGIGEKWWDARRLKGKGKRGRLDFGKGRDIGKGLYREKLPVIHII